MISKIKTPSKNQNAPKNEADPNKKMDPKMIMIHKIKIKDDQRNYVNPKN